MEKIDEGWQYNIYDLGDRVRKEPKDKLQISLAQLKSCPWRLFRPLKLRSTANELIDLREKSIKELKSRDFDHALLGDIHFEEDCAYEQEKVDVIEDLWGEKDGEKIIDDYTSFIHDCWRQGFSESTFNFTINNGYNSEGDMVLVDIGELVFSKEKVAEQIENEKWLNQRVYKWGLPRKLKPYFKQKMSEKITLEKLEEHWKSDK